MSYTKLTDFAVKDSLLTGNPAKIVRGTEIDAEFSSIEVNDAQNIKPSTIVAATTKATPVDADLLPLVDSAASNILKKLTWANLKATLLTWLQGTVLPAPGPIGSTTPSTGAFTTVSASGTFTRNATAATDTLISDANGSTTGYSYSRIRNTSGNAYVGVEGSTAGTLSSGTLAYAAVYGSAANQATQIITNNTVRMTIDTSGNVGVGTATPESSITLNRDNANGLVIRTADTNGSTLDAGVSSTNGYSYIAASRRGTGSFLPLAFFTSGAERLRIDSAGNLYAGTTVTTTTARIGARGATADSTTYAFHVENSSAATLISARNDGRVYLNGQTIGQSGNTIGLGTASPQTGAGISFPATQVASTDANTLDDYEEGTFTPTILGGTTAGVGTYSAQTGTYTKIGRQVSVHLYLNWSAHTGTGNLAISGLPFTSSSAASRYYSASIGDVSNITLTASNVMTAYVGPASAQMVVKQTPAGGGASSNVAIDTVGFVLLSLTYEV